jgi:PAS domain S-box-containing protein
MEDYEQMTRAELVGLLRTRKDAEGLLWLREQEFERLAENIPDLVARFDRDRRYLYVNAAVEKALGISRHQILGKTQRELGMPDELAAKFEESLDLVVRTGDVHTLEFSINTQQGERFLDAYHVPEGGMRHRVETVLCVARDVTERKLVELAAHRSAALAHLLESLARAANEALTPEAAMGACLERICAYGGWVIGRVALYRAGTPKTAPWRSIWHTADRKRFEDLIVYSDLQPPHPGGGFLGRALREQAAIWVEDFIELQGAERKAVVLRNGLRSGFVFPVIVRGDVVSVLEVFSEEPRAADPLIIGVAQSIASQLARIVERESAHEANARMAAIVESSRDAIVSRRLDGTILTWNPGAERMLGYTAAEMVGRNIREIIPAELHSSLEHRQMLFQQGEAVPGHETVRITKDGRRIDVATSPAPLRNANGEIWAYSTIIRDITQRKRRERELRESEERFRLLAENIDQVFWINTLALDGNIYVSPAYEKIWGRSRDSLRSDPNGWMASIHPEDLPRVRAAMNRITEGNQLDVEYRIRRPDGTVRWIRDRSYPMTRADGTPLLCGLAEDITDQKRVAAEQLEQAVRQRDALVREVHHRIKNSLQGVAGLLRQKVAKHPAIAPGIEEAIAQLQSVALVYGLQGTRSDGLLSLAEVTDAICASAESLIGGRVERTFERRSLRSACLAGSEAVSVAVALNELVFNALKHQRAAAGKKRARVELSESRGMAEIRISNRGHLPSEFDFTTGRAVGNGLGLVRALLVAPGGSIAFTGKRNEVEVVLKLSPPLLAERGKSVSG